MSKSKFIYTILFLIFFLSGCSSSTVDTTGKIVSPQNKLLPIEGKWEIERCLTNAFEEITGSENNQWNSKIVQFSDTAVVIGEDLFKAPQYKIKRVNTEEYLLYRHKQPADKYGISDKEVQVITISVKDLYTFDAVLTDNGKLIIEFEDFILYLNKISDEADNSLINMFNEKNGISDKDSLTDSYSPRTGLVLGLKYPGKDATGELEYKYRTIWIGSENRKLGTVLETKGIFFPRHDGFWRIETKRIKDEGRREDIFYGYSVINGSAEELDNIVIDTDKWGDRTGSITRSITYVCNDYIGIESIGAGGYKEGSGRWNENSLQLQLVDNLPNLKDIKIFDLAGDAGTAAMNNGKREALGAIKMGNISMSDMVQQYGNYGLFRKAGHWLFKGRLNYESEGEFKFSDFNINIIPPPQLVFYDNLNVTWTQIMDRVPEAVDAYTSPNRDIALIITKNRILVYEIKMGNLGDMPMRKIELKNGETVIMAEWANGSYMGSWEKSFMKNDVYEIK